ncbi:hypothetical protein GC170_13915 [bacterium]|nr:hypothetical protein [bacterium]
MVTVTRNQTQGELAPRVRIGVGGRWSAEELQRSLHFILKSTGWQVLTRSAENSDADGNGAMAAPATQLSVPMSGMVEIVPLGDGLSQVFGFPESEELDAVVISPLAESGADTDGMTARRYLARFVRQLRPGGATIFAADDPVSDIFSAIRLDCRRLGYRYDSENRSSHHDQAGGDANPGMQDRCLNSDDDATTAERTRLELAALAVVQAFGLNANATSGNVGVFAV